MNKPKVSVMMLTYNHESFIGQAIESVLAQQRDFEIEIVIGDDKSSDNTSEIVKSYQATKPQIFTVLTPNRNEGALANQNRTLQKCCGEYIAFLEGDDYWTDPNKLQKQVNFLDKNPGYSICGTRYHILKAASDQPCSEPPQYLPLFEAGNNVHEITMDNLYHPYALKTLTVMLRNNSWDISIFSNKYLSDSFLWAAALQRGKGACLNFFGGVYREHFSGSWSQNTDLKKSIINYQMLREMNRYFKPAYRGLQWALVQTESEALKRLVKSKFLEHFKYASTEFAIRRSRALRRIVPLLPLRRKVEN